MSSKNNNEIISIAKPHTIKKFELIERYVDAWSQILLSGYKCNKLIYIDCMCNSGEYTDEKGKTIWGSAVRVDNILYNASLKYPNKKIIILFNDYNAEKIEHLKTLVHTNTDNFKVVFKNEDANAMLKRYGNKIKNLDNTHTLLLYDPYNATIDWGAIRPFINAWGEVIINHMVSDPIRALKNAKLQPTIDKYEMTYLSEIEDLLPYGTDKNAYEERIQTIIRFLNSNKRRNYYIASFPFFIRTNNIEYNLLHCTGHIKGFRLFKESVWKTFDGKSSIKKQKDPSAQLTIDFSGSGILKTDTDPDCYTLHNIAEYLQETFCGKQNVPLDEMWSALDIHPVFPSDGYRKEIIKILKDDYGATRKMGSNRKYVMNFNDRGLF